MSFFLRYFLPVTYFRASRLNRVPLIAYNALIEWIPAVGLSLYFNSFDLKALGTVALSYLAFISIYEIGYLTNDYLSEMFEKDPRGRGSISDVTKSVLGALIVVRLVTVVICTYFLDTWTNPIWLAFHGTLAASFLLHNIVDRDLRLPTFFSLSTYRFFAPIILSVQPAILIMLLPIVMLNNSLYRLTVYADNKKITQRQGIVSKFGFYLACLPLGLFFSVLFNSLVPVAVTLYFLLVWTLYLLVSRVTGTDFRG
jgi:hypothetical protein